jgi:hypothetical protein
MGPHNSRPENYTVYKWSPAEMKHGLSTRKVCSFSPGKPDRDDKICHFCSICYLYYPKVNATECCHNGICTECVFATIDPDFHRAQCPFCRATPFKIVPDGTISPSGDDPAYLSFDAKRKAGELDTGILDTPEQAAQLPPEMEAIAKDISSHCHFDIRTVRDLLLAGVSPDEIAASAQ